MTKFEGKLSFWQRLVLKINGKVFIEYRKGESLPYFVGRCNKHGLYITHVQGYHDEMRCPDCEIEKEFFEQIAYFDNLLEKLRRGEVTTL